MDLNNNFTIQFVSKVTGLNPHTIRAWEKRYNTVEPGRLSNGRRFYTQSQIEKLSILAKLVNFGSSISSIASLNLEKLQDIHNEYISSNKDDITKINSSDSLNNLQNTLQNLTMAIKGFRLEVVSHELDKLIANTSPRDFALSVFKPLVYEVGLQVDNGSLTIAQEHAFSALMKFHLGKILFSFNQTQDDSQFRKTAIICAPEGEVHEFGLYISALLCLHHGVKFIFLGGNLPIDSLIMTNNQIEHDIVIIGCSQYFRDNNYNHLKKYINNFVDNSSEKTKVWVGGVKPFEVPNYNSRVNFVSTLQLLDSELAKLVL
jgi:MerR family transcriptional regulator, light-induced transcriptional regulator